MIPIVEELLENTITAQLKVIKENPQIIEKVFNYANTPYGKKFRKYIVNNNINVIKGFPRDASQLPCYCIMLGGEEETHEAIGEYLEQGDEMLYLTDEYQVKKEEDKVFIDTDKNNIESVVSINNLNTGKEIVNCAYDDEKKGRILLLENAEENDTVEATIGYLCSDEFKHGTLMNFNYKIECWADNSELVIYMYHLLKFIMLYKRQLLIENGIIKPILQGTDLEPIPDYFPTFAYRRSLIINGSAENYYDDKLLKDILVEIDDFKIIQHLYSDDKSIIK